MLIDYTNGPLNVMVMVYILIVATRLPYPKLYFTAVC